MNILSKLTPAETLLLKYCGTAELKDLVKYTFMDLLLKNVIKIDNVEKKAHARDTHIRSYTYIVAGKNLKKYKYKGHEFMFLSAFLKSESIQILFSSYVRMVYDSAQGNWNYKKLIKSSDNINLYFKETFFSKLFRNLLLTKNGSNVRSNIVSSLDKMDEEVSKLTARDTEKALEIMMSIGGNIFLLKNLNFELLRDIDEALINNRKHIRSDLDDTYIDFWIYLDGDSLHNIFDSIYDGFNDVLEAFDSEYDASSCSSFDSDGCNSCDGCGGCD